MWWLLGDCLDLHDSRFAREAGRPELSGEEHVTARGRWVVHWTDSGSDAITGDDADHDGTPDAIPRLFDALDFGAARYEADGWRPILDDDGRGGDTGIDVYLRIVDINGYAHPVDVNGETGHSCYIEVDPTLSGQGTVLESVAVHELHHCVQYAYTIDTSPWMFESTATWEQYRIWPDDDLLRLAQAVLWGTRLSRPDLPMDETEGRYEYAGFVFVKFWTEYLGTDESRLPALWEALHDDPDWQVALDAEARRLWGIDLDTAYLAYTTWNGFACGRDDGDHWRTDILPCASDVTVPIEPAGASITVDQPDAAYVARYFEIPADGDARPLRLACDPAADDAWVGASITALDADGLGGEDTTSLPGAGEPVDAALTMPLDPAGSALVAFTSTGDVPGDLDCTITRVDPVPEPSCGCGTARAPVPAALLAVGLLARRRRGTVRG